MAGFLYFRPGSTGAISREEAVRLGLGYMLDKGDALSCCGLMAATPSGQQGSLFAVDQRMGGKPLKYAPDEQTWRKAGKLEVWVGVWKDAPPKPNELARSKQLPGDQVRLSDEQMWTVPKVLQLDAAAARYEAALPAAWDFDDEGNWVRGSVVDEYRHLWDLAVPFADEKLDIVGGEHPLSVEMDNSRLLDTVVELLQTNYVVSQVELVLLRALVSDSSVALVPLLAADYLTLLEWLEDQKKSGGDAAPSGSDTSDGKAA